MKSLALCFAAVALCMLCSLSGCSSSAKKVTPAAVTVLGGEQFWEQYRTSVGPEFRSVTDFQRKEIEDRITNWDKEAFVPLAVAAPIIAEGVKLLLKQVAKELDKLAEDYRVRFAGDTTLIDTGAFSVGQDSGKIAGSFYSVFQEDKPKVKDLPAWENKPGWVGGIIVTRSVKGSDSIGTIPTTVIVYGVLRISRSEQPAVYEIVPLCYYAKEHAAKRIGPKRTIEADLKLDIRQTTPSLGGRGPASQPLVSLTTRVAKFTQSDCDGSNGKPVFFVLDVPSPKLGESESATQSGGVELASNDLSQMMKSGRVHGRSYRLFASEPFFAPPQVSAVRIGFAADERDAGKTRKILKGLGKALDNNAGKIGDAVGDLAKPSDDDTAASTNG